jgi:hypothetical protein
MEFEGEGEDAGIGSGEIEEVLFRGEEEVGAGGEDGDFGGGVAVVVGEGFEEFEPETGGGEGDAEGFGLAESAERPNAALGERGQDAAHASKGDGGVGIAAADFGDEAGVAAAGACAGEDDEVGAGEGGEGFAKEAEGEDAAAEGVEGVDEDDVEFAAHPPVLEAIVEEDDIGSAAGGDGGKPVDATGGDSDCGEASAVDELGLFAGGCDGSLVAGEEGQWLFVLPFVAPQENGGEEAAGGGLTAEPDDERGFAGTAHGEVADGDDGDGGEVEAEAVEGTVRGDGELPEFRERGKGEADGEGAAVLGEGEVVLVDEGFDGADGGSALGKGALKGALAEGAAGGRVGEEGVDLVREIGGVGDPQRPMCEEIVGDGLEVLVVGAGDDGAGEGGGFEEVVAAARGDGAADEDDIGDGEQRAEFADGVENKDAGPGERGERGAADEGDARGGEALGGGVEAFGAAGNEDEQKRRVARGEFLVNAGNEFVLVDVAVEGRRHGGSGEDDGRGGVVVEEIAQVGGDLGEGGVEVELEVAVVPGVGGAEGLVAALGDGVLGEKFVWEGEGAWKNQRWRW